MYHVIHQPHPSSCRKKMAEREVVLLLLLFGFAASSYWKKPEYSREVPDTKMLLLAKPAFVPFTERDAAVLVHVEERLLRRCLSKDDSLPAVIRLRDEKGMLSVETTIEDSAPEKTIDRFGERVAARRHSVDDGGRRRRRKGTRRLRVSARRSDQAVRVCVWGDSAHQGTYMQTYTAY